MKSEKQIKEEVKVLDKGLIMKNDERLTPIFSCCDGISIPFRD